MSAVDFKPSVVEVPKVARILAVAVALMLLLEVALQVRSQFRDGQSVFNLMFRGTAYVEDKKTGLRLLRPNSAFPGSRITLRGNSLGLRSPEIPLPRTPGSSRLAVIGASTVMGLYDSDTEATFPARLEKRLREQLPGKKIEVVNAGMVGFALDDQRRMLETRVAQLKPDLVIVYPGFNDFLRYCWDEGTSITRIQHEGLPMLSLPDWVSTPEQIRRHTVFLRTTKVRQINMKNPDDFDLKPYRSKLEALVKRAAELHLPLVFSTNARAYHREQPLDEQLKLSQSARYFNRCFDLNGLHLLYDRHNAEIRAVAQAHRIPLIDLGEQVPGGARYFVDAQHFTAVGASLVADKLADFLVQQRLLPE